MHARVATYRGAEAAGLDEALAAITAQVDLDLDDPPEGLGGLREVLLLVDRENGRALAVTLFDSAEALDRGEAVLSRRPMSQAGGVRTDVERYEIAYRRARA